MPSYPSMKQVQHAHSRTVEDMLYRWCSYMISIHYSGSRFDLIFKISEPHIMLVKITFLFYIHADVNLDMLRKLGGNS